jgi:hypothetical protein
MQQLTYASGIDVGAVCHHDQFMGDGIQRAEHVKALASGRSPDEMPGETPQYTQIRR